MLLSATPARAQIVPPGMIWVTWRQHRGLLIAVPAFCAAMVTAMLTEGWKIHRDYARLAACHPFASATCQNLVNVSHNDWHVGNGIRVALLAGPVLLAMFAGPPVLARELESGMFRYSWTQGLGRVRWTAGKLAFLGSVVTLAAVLLSLVFTWFFAPFLSTQQLTPVTPAVFQTYAVVYAGWALTAFCLGAFLGPLFRRVVPAMAASLVCFAVLYGVTLWPRDSSGDSLWPMQLLEGACLLAASALLCLGTLRLVRRQAA